MATRKKSVSKEPKAQIVAEPTLKAPRGTKFMLQVGLITLPVKLSVGARAERVQFRKVHIECLTGLKMQEQPGQMFCPTCEDYVPREDISRAYEVSRGQFVLLTDAEIEAQKPDTDKLIEIDTFVCATEIDPIYFESSHYLSAEEGGARPFVLVREMLRRTNKVGIGKATILGQEHTVIIRPFGDGLALHKMFHLNELNIIDYGVGKATVNSNELELAGKLVESMSSTFNPSQYSDRYMANIKALVASKEAGTAPSLPEKKKRPVAVDLMAALSQSVAEAKKRRAA